MITMVTAIVLLVTSLLLGYAGLMLLLVGVGRGMMSLGGEGTKSFIAGVAVTFGALATFLWSAVMIIVNLFS